MKRLNKSLARLLCAAALSSGSVLAGDDKKNVDTLKGDSPFIVSAPSDEASAKLPAGVTPERVSSAEFMKEYALVDMPQTMHSVTYLGQRDGRAYINHSSKSVVSGKWSNRVIFVDLAELDAKFRDSLPKTTVKEKAAKTDTVDTAGETAYAKLKGNRVGVGRPRHGARRGRHTPTLRPTTPLANA